MSWPWSELGLPGPTELPEIRRAYAQRLKTTHPEDDPEGFQRLHAAYQQASRDARRRSRGTPEPDTAVFSGGGASGQPSATMDPGESLEDSGQPPCPPAPEPQAPVETSDWNYERLFAEGEAEAREANLRRMEQLRRKNRARYAAQQRQSLDRDETRDAVLLAIRALELLYASGASPAQWQRFLDSPAFLSVRANLDFIFALEDFLERHPDLSLEIRRAIFRAYEFQNGSRYPIYRRLYQLLGVHRQDRRRLARERSVWRNRWRSFPAWRKTGIAVCFSILAVFMAVGLWVNLRGAYRDFTQRREAKQWQVQSLQWLEEDFGQAFVHPLEDREEICAPAADPSLYFWILPDGERSERRAGYRTDYPHILLKRKLEEFAEAWGLGLRFDSAGEGYQGSLGEAPGAYLFDLPLLGAGEAITALGALLDDLKAESWYRVLQDKYGGAMTYQIFLCHGELSFYDAVSTEGGGFDAGYARAQYEAHAGGAFCRYILEQSGLAARHMGEDAYILQDQGTEEISGETFFRVTGLQKDGGQPLVQYFLASGGRVLFCLPEGAQARITHVTDLYRGTSLPIELEGVGLVMAWDQIQPE